ncbi:helix-turn-helix domain-containing protein [Nocardiopsis eucommiae]|uniref:helix-turn-helix domain-containing protein n=1 Tax=Nocardiopsis eucommiae TaxID=2831970 RepID=UPI003D764981
MTHDTPDTTGQRIARARKQRGLTQQGLADRTRYSRSHIAQVEKGHKEPTPAFVVAVANTLREDPDALSAPSPSVTDTSDRMHTSIPHLRRALAWSDLPPDLDGPPRPLDTLATELVRAQHLRRIARHGQLGGMLPAVIEELSHHAHTSDTPQAWELLTDAYAAAGELTRRLGYTDLADSMFKEAGRAAGLSEDPHLPLIITWRRSLVLIQHSALGAGTKLLEHAISRVDRDHPGADEVIGALHLRAAIISGRSGQASRAWGHYGEAREVSDRVDGRKLDTYSTYFVGANVAIHGAAVATELGDYDEAVRRDEMIPSHDLQTLLAERQAHHSIDMSRVHLETGQKQKALEKLVRAERGAPQMTRFHPSARMVAARLVPLYRDLPEPLRGLMSRMHL